MGDEPSVYQTLAAFACEVGVEECGMIVQPSLHGLVLTPGVFVKTFTTSVTGRQMVVAGSACATHPAHSIAGPSFRGTSRAPRSASGSDSIDREGRIILEWCPLPGEASGRAGKHNAAARWDCTATSPTRTGGNPLRRRTCAVTTCSLVSVGIQLERLSKQMRKVLFIRAARTAILHSPASKNNTNTGCSS